MANPYNNYIRLGNETLIDLRSDTVVANKLIAGLKAHAADGSPIVGTLDWTKLTPQYYDYHIGYVDNGVWKYENPTNTYTDIYQVQSGKKYYITLGLTHGTRFRAMFTTVDVTTRTSGQVNGTAIVNQNNPASYANAAFTAPSNGYIIVAKDNVGHSGLFSYVYDYTDVLSILLEGENLV